MSLQPNKNILIRTNKSIFAYIAIFLLILPTLITLILFQKAHASTPYLASDVLGQSNFTSNNAGLTSTTLDGPASITIDYTNHRMFVADGSNGRVLVFQLDSSNNLVDKTADFVIGKPDFTSAIAATTQSGMGWPSGVAYDEPNNRLFVSDWDNSRVTVYDLSGGITNGMNASYVLGQPDFVTSNDLTTQDGMFHPGGVEYDTSTERLFVADYDNGRALVFDLSSGITNGMNASYVLGQPDFTTSNPLTTQSGMDGPYGLELNTTSQTLYIADFDNSRVLVFNLSGGITNGMNASFVLGQPNFTSSTGATTQSGMNAPLSVALDKESAKLFVQEGVNNRITIYDTTSITNGQAAVGLIGQTDFTSSVSGTTQFNFLSGNDGSSTMEYDYGNNRLWVTDYTNNRVLSFDFAKFTNSSASPVFITEATFGQPYNYTISTENTQGTVTCSLASGSLPTGVTLNPDCTITGTPASNTVYNFSVLLSDNNGNAGTFTSTQSFSLTVNHASAVPTLAPTGQNSRLIPIVALILLLVGAGGDNNCCYEK